VCVHCVVDVEEIQDSTSRWSHH